MLCQAFTAAPCSCCLLQGLSALSFVLSKWKTCSIVLRSGERLTTKIYCFFALRSSWVAFAVCHYPSVLCYQFCGTWLNCEQILQPYTCQNSGPIPLAAILAHPITLPPPCLTDDVVYFGLAWDVSFFLSPHFSLPISMVQVYPSFICPKNLGPESGYLFQTKSYLAFRFFSVASGLHSVRRARMPSILRSMNDLTDLPPPEYSWLR